MKLQGDIVVTTSKGDNFKVKSVVSIKTNHGKAVVIQSVDELQLTVDVVMRDRDIYMENVEVVDVGF